MKIALLGYGKMGTMIERMALQQGHEIVCRITSNAPRWDDIARADICIDFSHADAVIEHLERAARYSKPVVIGTTGWDSRMEEAQAIAQHIGVLFAPNFSLGVHLFLNIVESAAKLINRFAEYDIGGIEFHHAQKKDAPSGTALAMARRLKEHIDRIDDLEIAAVRVGSIPGKHAVLFDSNCDTITISHEARSREGFAKGALAAGEWLLGKTGFFTLDDYFIGVCHES